MLTYLLILFLRHLFYDKGWKKSYPTDVPSVCVGNIALGGTGKTPMVEHIIRTLQEDEVEAADAEEYGFVGSLFDVPKRNIAVLSRGYKRKSKGFQQVLKSSSATEVGDEPLQIKQKFSDVTVAVDTDRVEGASLLAHPSRLKALPEKVRSRIKHSRFPASDIIILDDAMQHRRIRPNITIMLSTYSRPFWKDALVPFGKLRDLRRRAYTADAIVVTKCPPYMQDNERFEWASRLGMTDFNPDTCTGTNREGKKQLLIFATTRYEALMPVFPEGDPRYIHSKQAIMFSGIANDKNLQFWVSKNYHLMHHRSYPDHHPYTQNEILDITKTAEKYLTSIVVTTEKDAQRLRGCTISDGMKRRIFYAPITMVMLTAGEQTAFKNLLNVNLSRR